jgi:hypothetical protein
VVATQQAGALFLKTTTGTFTLLRSLTSIIDGASPRGSLVLGTMAIFME